MPSTTLNLGYNHTRYRLNSCVHQSMLISLPVHEKLGDNQQIKQEDSVDHEKIKTFWENGKDQDWSIMLMKKLVVQN